MFEKLPPIDFYPYNLLLAIKGQSGLQFPEALTEDVLAGFQYILSTLEDRSRTLLHLRYREGNTLEEAAAQLGLTPEQAKEAERSAITLLRRPSHWNYIQFGIAGYVKRTAREEYNKGYLHGYQEGFRLGSQNVRSQLEVDAHLNDILNQPIEALNLTPRVFNVLDRYDRKFIRDIIPLTEEEIMRMRGLGKTAAEEVAQALRTAGIPMTDWYRFLP